MDFYAALAVVAGIAMSLVVSDLILVAVFKAMDLLDPGRTRTGVRGGSRRA